MILNPVHSTVHTMSRSWSENTGGLFLKLQFTVHPNVYPAPCMAISASSVSLYSGKARWDGLHSNKLTSLTELAYWFLPPRSTEKGGVTSMPRLLNGKKSSLWFCWLSATFCPELGKTRSSWSSSSSVSLLEHLTLAASFSHTLSSSLSCQAGETEREQRALKS